MEPIGLTAEKVDEILRKHNIIDGNVASAENIRAAIAEVIVENNKVITDEVANVVATEFSDSLSRLR